jgi:hypothetical protein
MWSVSKVLATQSFCHVTLTPLAKEKILHKHNSAMIIIAKPPQDNSKEIAIKLWDAT